MAGRHFWFGIASLLTFSSACSVESDREEEPRSFGLGPGGYSPDQTDISREEEHRIVASVVTMLGAFSSGSEVYDSNRVSAPPQTGSLCIVGELAPSSAYDFSVQRFSPGNSPINRAFEGLAKQIFAGRIQRRAALTINPQDLEEAGSGIDVEQGCSTRLPPLRIHRPQVRGNYALIKFRATDTCWGDHWMILRRSEGRWLWVTEATETMFSPPFLCERESVRAGMLRISAQPARSSRSGTISPA